MGTRQTMILEYIEYIANDMIPGSGSGGHSAAKIHGISMISGGGTVKWKIHHV